MENKRDTKNTNINCVHHWKIESNILKEGVLTTRIVKKKWMNSHCIKCGATRLHSNKLAKLNDHDQNVKERKHEEKRRANRAKRQTDSE